MVNSIFQLCCINILRVHPVFMGAQRYLCYTAARSHVLIFYVIIERRDDVHTIPTYIDGRSQ